MTEMFLKAFEFYKECEIAGYEDNPKIWSGLKH